MTNMNTVIYNLLKQAVMYYPTDQSNTCLQPKAFAVIDDFSDLNTANLKKTIYDAGKPYFWSQSWSAHNYDPNHIAPDVPIMVVFEEPFIIAEGLKQGRFTQYSWIIGVLDNYDPDLRVKNTYCQRRTRNEVYHDTEIILRNCVDYLLSTVYATNIITGDTFPNINNVPDGWYNTGWLAGLPLPPQGDPPPKPPDPPLPVTWIEDTKKTREFINGLKRANESINGDRWVGSMNNYYGTTIQLKFNTSYCPSIEFDFSNMQDRDIRFTELDDCVQGPIPSS